MIQPARSREPELAVNLTWRGGGLCASLVTDKMAATRKPYMTGLSAGYGSLPFQGMARSPSGASGARLCVAVIPQAP